MKTAIITGCSSGIGRAAAVELTARGYEVVATARRPETLSDLAVARKLTLDVDDEASVAEAVAAAGPVDVLVNNAGFGVDGAVETTPLGDVRRMFDTNFFGAARMIQAFLPQMRKRGAGAIVNVTSLAGVAVSPLGGYYAASKWALEALSEALHLEVGHFGIRVVVIEPGFVDTNFGDNRIEHRAGPGPYAPLASQWEAASALLAGDGAKPGPQLVATAIGDALESPVPRLRVPVGADAELVTAVRIGKTYEEFEATMREALRVDW